MKKVERLYDNLAGKFTERKKKELGRDDSKHLQKFLRLLPKGSRVLDVGCGPGVVTKIFVDEGHKVEGFDFSKELVRIAKGRVPGARLKVMDMRKMDYADNSFDAICAFQSIIHIPKKDVNGVLIRFNKMLTDKGLLFLALQEGRGERCVYWKLAKDKVFINYYSIYGISKLLKVFGLEVMHWGRRPAYSQNTPGDKLLLIAKKARNLN